MIIFIECIVLCFLFTLIIYVMAKEPIKTLYNYPPKIQERVKEIEEYKDKIPTTKNKITAKLLASVIIIILVSLILRYVNGYTAFKESFYAAFFIWTVVNIYDVLILDICWFCQSKKFIFKGTEDILQEYKNYFFHIKEGIIGEVLGFVISIIVSVVIHFIL